MAEVLWGVDEEQLIAEHAVPGGDLAVIELPMDAGVGRAVSSSAVSGAAYRLSSDLPVTAYRFNPLDTRRSSTRRKGIRFMPTPRPTTRRFCCPPTR